MGRLDLNDFNSESPRVKYACGKRAIELSKEYPEELYSEFDIFIKLLTGNNTILKWNAIQVIGNLSKVDKDQKVDNALPILFALLKDRVMITAANSIGALTEIAKNKPEHQEIIVNELLKVEKAKYYSKGELSPECRNVAIGHVINSFDKLGENIYGRKDVAMFLRRQTKNSRKKVRESAENLLKKVNKK